MTPHNIVIVTLFQHHHNKNRRKRIVNFLLTAALLQIFLAHFRFHVILKSDLNDIFFNKGGFQNDIHI